MKRIVGFIFLAIIIAILPSESAKANAPEENSIMSLHDSGIACELIASAGSVSGYISVNSLTSDVIAIEATIELQEKSGLFFRTIATDYASSSGRNLVYYSTYATTAGNKYRLEATITVYYSVGNDRETVRSTVITGI